MNDSRSTISPAWPTSWPKDSFRGAGTWILAFLGGATFVGAFAVGALKPDAVSLTSITPLQIYLSIGLSLGIEGIFVAVILIALPRLSKFSLRELGFRTPGLATLGTAVLGAFAMIVVANGLASLLENLMHASHQQDVVEVFRNLHDRTAVAVFAGFAIVVAPIFEEIIFRVFFFNLGLRYGGFWLGAIVSGALFGMAHGDPYAAVPLALGGMVLCYVYYRSRNAWASMISHSIFNAVSILALLYAPTWLTK